MTQQVRRGIRSALRAGATASLPVAGLMAALIVPATGHAQAAPAAGAGALEEVVVTARKRSESLQEVPISITAMGSDEIAARSAIRVRDLGDSVPNVVFVGPSDSSATILSMRGVQSQSRINVGFESGIGVYVDGVVMGRSIAFNQELYDIERVEFLRGPQGTLFGKNSISGAISITTRRPSTQFTGSASLELTDYDGHAGSIYLSGPLVEGKVYASASGYTRQREGFVTNVPTGQKVDEEDSQGGRVKLLFTPSDGLEITLAADAMQEDPYATSSQAISGYGAVSGEYLTNVSLPTLAERDSKGTSLTIDWKLGGGTLTSITAYREMSRDRTNDTDVGPLKVVDTFVTNDQNQVSQELRYAGRAGETVDYVVGAYYFKQDVDSSSVSCFGTIAGIPPFLRGLCGDTTGNITTKSYAGFVNFDWRFADTWTAVAGARYTQEDKDLGYKQNGFPFIAPTIPFQTDSRSDSDVSPTLGLRWQPSGTMMLYATASRGYKSGGWNVDNVATNSITSFSQLAFGPENVLSYELGAKTEWFDRKLSANLAVFYMDYNDMQVSKQVPVLGGGGAIVGITTNAGAARVKGFEFELVTRPATGLELTAGVGYANAEYTDYVDTGTGGGDFAGNKLDNAPEWTANASAQYRVPLGGVEGLFRVDWTYRDDYFVGRNNLPTQMVKGWDLLNARIGIVGGDGAWELSLFGRNVLDKTYYVNTGPGGFAFPGVGTNQTVTYGQPRLWGGELKINF